jgi:small redox-active disulfide protein 2
MHDIKVLGPGCKNCERTEEIVRRAVDESGVEAKIEKINGAMDIAKFGVFGTPAVVIDDEVKVVGRVPELDEVKAWLAG